MKFADLPWSRRFAAGLFLLALVHFYLHAQWNLRLNVGGGAFPSVSRVLEKYHGKPTQTRLEFVLEPTRDRRENLAMYQYLDGDYEGPETQRRRYDRILAWVREGAPESGWAGVKEIFTHPRLCASCHAAGKEMASAPLTRFEGVVKYARAETGMSERQLGKLSHSHLAGFALLGLAVSLLFTFTRYRRTVAAPLFLLVFLGPMLDVTGWWLTRYHGMPWPYLIMAGGAMFGAGLMAMVALCLDELWLGALLGRTLSRVLRPLGFRLRD